MPSNTFFLESPLAEGEVLSLEDEEFHHAKAVMRVSKGETLHLVNGKGVEAEGSIQSIEKKSLSLLILSRVEHTPKIQRLTLGVPLLRASHLDFVIEKGVELGVDQFLLFPADLSERKEWSPALQRRLKAICVAALKQSGRLFLPELTYKNSLKEAFLFAPRPLVWADISSEAKTLENRLQGEKERKELSLFIGPEAGWSIKEKKLFNESGPPIWLHDTILRAETAGMIGAYAGFCWLKQEERHGSA